MPIQKFENLLRILQKTMSDSVAEFIKAQEISGVYFAYVIETNE